MTNTQTTTQPTKPTTGSRRPLYHGHADTIQYDRAQAGLSWLTRCGIWKPPTRRAAVPGWTLAPMEKCAVCVALEQGTPS